MWTRAKMTAVIMNNDDQLCKALVKLYDRQTNDEKADRSTKYKNDRGFNHADARMLSSFAQQYLVKGSLTKYQLDYARPRMAKYVRQLCRIANSNG